MGRLDGKVAIITGAARGQGAAEAELFVQQGARVVLTDVLEELGHETAGALGDDALFLRQDVGDETGWAEVVDATLARFGRIDVLINNAAILHMAAIEDYALEDFERVVRVNQIGPFLGMRSVVGPMRDGGGGSIVNVSSVDGIVGMNGVAAYAATKFAVRGLTRVGALEFGKYGIRVNTLHPGGVETPMGAPPEAEAVQEAIAAVDPVAGGSADDPADNFFSHHPIPRIGQPREIASVALFLASDDSSYCTGAEFVADGGQITGSRVQGVPGY